MSKPTSAPKLTQEYLKEILHYNKDTGIFTWMSDRKNVKIGQTAGSIVKSNGYHSIQIDGKKYKTHRLAWLYVEGYFPENMVDHINRDRSDNRFCNLREVSRSCNTRNCKISKNNKTGVNGVSLHKKTGLYFSRINGDGNCIGLGYHKLKIDAVKARWAAEVKYNYPNCNTTSSAYQYLKKQGIIYPNEMDQNPPKRGRNISGEGRR